MASPLDTSRLSGCCLLGPDGSIGFIDRNGNVEPDAQLTEALRGHARSLLAAAAPGADAHAQRIGVVFDAAGTPWRAPTLLFDDDVVRTLFPVAGPQTAQLTNFQRRNRYRSLYQAFELLLAFRRQSMPGVPLYCPALIDRGTTLGEYPDMLAGDAPAADPRAPALEVVNLIEGMAHGERRGDAVAQLLARLRDGVVHPEARRGTDLDLVDEIDPGMSADADVDDPYGEVRRRREEAIETPRVDAGPAAPPAPAAGRGAALRVGPALLRSFTSFEGFDAAALERIAAHTAIHDAAAGTCLVKAGTIDEWNYFLLEGTLALRAIDNETTLLRAGSAPARAPVARLLPRHYTVTASTPVRYLRVHQALLREAQGADSGCPAPAIDSTERHPLIQALEHELAGGSYVLPGPPAIEAAVRGAAPDAGDQAAALARALAGQPLLAARLVGAAGMPAYGGGAVAGVDAALTRLGAGTARDLVVAFALKELFETVPPGERARAEAAWARSTSLASLSFALARVVPGFSPARALLCGAVYDVGTVAIIGYASRHPEITRHAGDLDAALTHLRGAVGACLLRRWQFAEEIARAAMEADNWYRDPGGKADYCDLVLAARLHSVAGTERASELPALGETPAFGRLAALVPALTPGLDVLRERRGETEEVQQLLRG